MIFNNLRPRPRLFVNKAWTLSTEQTSNLFVFYQTASSFPSCEWRLLALQLGHHPFFFLRVYFLFEHLLDHSSDLFLDFWALENLPLSFYPVCKLGVFVQFTQWGSGEAKEIFISFLNLCTAFKGPLICWEKTNNQEVIGDHLKGWLSWVNLVFIV